MVRAVGLLSALLLPVAGIAQDASAPASGATAVHRQLQHTQTELKSQRVRTEQLRARVNDLEQHSASDRAALDQRDREIEELKRKLAAMPTSPKVSPVPVGSH